MLKPMLFLSAILLLVLSPLPFHVHAAQEGAAAAKPSASAHTKVTPEAQAKAHKLYGVDCSMCHGDNGNGQSDLAKGMNLKLDDWTNPNSLAGKSDDELFDRIRKGKAQMPPEDAARATDDVVWGLIAMIRKMSATTVASH